MYTSFSAGAGMPTVLVFIVCFVFVPLLEPGKHCCKANVTKKSVKERSGTGERHIVSPG